MWQAQHPEYTMRASERTVVLKYPRYQFAKLAQLVPKGETTTVALDLTNKVLRNLWWRESNLNASHDRNVFYHSPEHVEVKDFEPDQSEEGSDDGWGTQTTRRMSMWGAMSEGAGSHSRNSKRVAKALSRALPKGAAATFDAKKLSSHTQRALDPWAKDDAAAAAAKKKRGAESDGGSPSQGAVAADPFAAPSPEKPAPKLTGKARWKEFVLRGIANGTFQSINTLKQRRCSIGSGGLDPTKMASGYAFSGGFKALHHVGEHVHIRQLGRKSHLRRGASNSPRHRSTVEGLFESPSAGRGSTGESVSPTSMITADEVAHLWPSLHLSPEMAARALASFKAEATSSEVDPWEGRNSPMGRRSMSPKASPFGSAAPAEGADDQGSDLGHSFFLDQPSLNRALMDIDIFLLPDELQHSIRTHGLGTHVIDEAAYMQVCWEFNTDPVAFRANTPHNLTRCSPVT